MLLAKQTSALIIGLTSLHTAFAIPAPETRSVIEVIPGESLPSLESLGWNSTYINSLPDPKFTHSDMSIMADGKCGSRYASVNDAIVCYKFLNALGTYPCTVPSGQRSAVLAYAGDIQVVGLGIEQSSYCRDVAVGVLWSIDHCTRPQQDVAGTAPAWGNGNYIISLQHI